MTFHRPVKRRLFKTLGGDAGNQHFLLLTPPPPSMFSTFPKTYFHFLITFILLVANAFNFDQSQVLLFGKELKKYLNY